MNSEQETWLTPEAYERLKNELDYLSTTGRHDIAKKIEAAREEGDLKENGGYHAAKDEQGKMEARIRNLQDLLKRAKVAQAPKSDGTVAVGTVITAEIMGDQEVFLLGNREISGNTDLDVYSETSPLGSSILGLKIGEKTSYVAPNGNNIEVKIISVDNFKG